MFSFTDELIAFAERYLLPSGAVFDAERREVIKCLESKDVLACPGSGKTTALLAKLLIISGQLPLRNNKGICVLTHTNVAIDIITQRMGLSISNFFNYPSHFGTIQSFVDKYLAIPAYVARFGRRPDIIDNDWYNSKVDTQFIFLTRKAKRFCHKMGCGKPFEFLHKICFRDLEVVRGNRCSGISLDLKKPEDIDIYRSLVKLKNNILEFGILSYDDAYYLASAHISAHPSLQSLFSKRFAYVFIDEMQDTSSKQLDIIGRLFDSSVVIQRIGDINQSIFNFGEEEDVCAWELPSGIVPLEITGSKRFSNAIARIVAPICEKPQPLTGNPQIPDIAPTIISFADNNIYKVIPLFGDLIVGNQLQLLPRLRFKALGWRAAPHGNKHTISSYWPLFQKELHTKRVDYSSLANYIEPESDDFIQKHSVDHYKKSIVRALLKCLRLADRPTGVPILSERALFNYLSSKDEEFSIDLRHRLAKWCLSIHKRQDVKDEIIGYMESALYSFFDITKNSGLADFLYNAPLQTAIQCQPQKSNIYTHTSQGCQIEIEICTIHGAKGETHTATLYLETFYYDYDINRIMAYLKGNHTTPSNTRIRRNLRMAYVGMSRPSHLLCVACHKDHLLGHKNYLEAGGWHIDESLT